MVIKTPDILPGEPGYISKKDRREKQKNREKKQKNREKVPVQIGKIILGSKSFRIGRPVTTPRKEKKFIIWRYTKKIGEVILSPNGNVNLKFFRFGGVANYKNLIQDVDFQRRWTEREQELLLKQNKCFLCGAKISRSAKPNLYHAKMWQKRAHILEEAEKIPEEVVEGELTVEEGWARFNDILEEGNRYYMSLEDTHLICASCAKKKGLSY
ncbi:MAG: hypothetical protein WC494_00360 [Candidatus Pacearchaeota archaeon]